MSFMNPLTPYNDIREQGQLGCPPKTRKAQEVGIE